MSHTVNPAQLPLMPSQTYQITGPSANHIEPLNPPDTFTYHPPTRRLYFSINQSADGIYCPMGELQIVSVCNRDSEWNANILITWPRRILREGRVTCCSAKCAWEEVALKHVNFLSIFANFIIIISKHSDDFSADFPLQGASVHASRDMCKILYFIIITTSSYQWAFYLHNQHKQYNVMNRTLL